MVFTVKKVLFNLAKQSVYTKRRKEKEGKILKTVGIVLLAIGILGFIVWPILSLFFILIGIFFVI